MGIDLVIKELEAGNVRFARLVTVCTAFFGEPRRSASSHVVFKTPWQGNPRINLQKDGSQAKRYQIGQVVDALRMLRSMPSGRPFGELKQQEKKS